MPDFTFHKTERLKSRKIIGQLFKDGQSVNAFPLRLVWMPAALLHRDFPIQFALTVPKRAFPKAVDRNRIRRQLREAYRLNKHLCYEAFADQEQQYALMVIYLAKEPLPYQKIEKAMKKGLKKWMRQL